MLIFPRLRLALRLPFLLVLASCCACVHAQNQEASAPPAGTQFPDLFGTWLANKNLTECETATRCDGLWEFNNSVNGKAFWKLRSITAELKVTKITPTTVEIWRIGDAFERVNGHYVGTLKDGIIEGDVTWFLLDSGKQGHGHWYASMSDAALRAKLGVEITALKPEPSVVQSQVSDAGNSPPAQASSPRRSMRICSQAGCQNLTWADGIYEGRSDGTDTVSTNFAIVRWGPGPVELTGVVLLNGPGNPVYPTGIFTGKLAPSGTEIESGSDAWRAGAAAGTIPYTLKWSANEPAVPLVAPSTAKLPPEIKLCIGQCFRLKLNGGHYDAFSTTGERPEKVATYSVARFSPDSVYMNLVEKSGTRAILLGTITDNTIVGGKVIWLNAYDGALGMFKASWGAEVESNFKTEETLHPEPCKATGTNAPAVKVAPEVMEKQLLRRVAIIYPDGMFRAARMQGNVYVDVIISSCGTVSAAVLGSGPGQANAPIFGNSAVIAVKKWLYKPYVVNGHPVSVKTQINVKVSIEEPDGTVTYPNGTPQP